MKHVFSRDEEVASIFGSEEDSAGDLSSWTELVACDSTLEDNRSDSNAVSAVSAESRGASGGDGTPDGITIGQQVFLMAKEIGALQNAVLEV